MSRSRQFNAIIFDLGDVLIKWSSTTKTSISSRTLHDILSSAIWYDYERGRLSEEDCYASVAAAFKLDPGEIRRALEQARNSLEADETLISLIRELKAQSGDQLRVFAMSNISLPDYEVLRHKPADWAIFDQIFTSGASGERKPNVGFYQYVIRKTGIDPARTIFIDDRLENILTARSVGWHGIVFESPQAVERILRNVFGDPVKRGRDFLSQNARRLHSEMMNGSHDTGRLYDNFTQLLILEATNDRTLVKLAEPARTWTFFQEGEQRPVKEEPSCDMDATCLGLTILRQDKQVASSTMDEMRCYVDVDETFPGNSGQRDLQPDPVICVNALNLFYTYGCGNELDKPLKWIQRTLQSRSYLSGTLHYPSPDSFLYFISRLLGCSGDAELHAALKPLLKERLQERVAASGDSIALATRVLACDFVGIRNETDLRTLLTLQCSDGGWEIGWIYKYGTSGMFIGNRGLATSLAIKAIEALGPLAIALNHACSPAVLEPVPPRTARRMTVSTRYSTALRNSLGWLRNGNRRKSVDFFTTT